MLRTLLIATALLTASSASFAHGGNYGHGRVITVEPQFVISFGSRHHDGFRVLYESGGSRYWTHTSYRPGRTIVLPPHHRVQHVHHYRDYGHRWDGRRDWNHRHNDWHHDARRHDRDGRRDYREHRRHGRD